ncbi:MAG: NTP transferase domain-containing protein [Gammaproteobacteria bacterium]|nr:NTP transferase domain-containing protein [Gammaproteobacteria bacterium]
MKFGRIPSSEAEGALLAHSLKSERLSFKKGRRLDAGDVRALIEAGFTSVVAAQLEADDVGEDTAAERISAAVRGQNLVASAPFTGRCNLYAAQSGVLTYDRAWLDALNLVDEAVTIAALPPFSAVQARQMIATIKIIPYGVAASSLDRVTGLAGTGDGTLSIAPFVPVRIGLIQTQAHGAGDRLFAKTRASVQSRIEALGSRLVAERHCLHDEQEIAFAVRTLLDQACELLLIAGASATADRRDVVPAGIELAGGRILHVGMPVEPGNLLLLAESGDGRQVICLPGCARSPTLNGFDWVLQRLLARLPVTREDIMTMGAGGLIKHQEQSRGTRPSAEDSLPRQPRIGVVVLAAGRPAHPDGGNPLLDASCGEAALRRVVRVASASQAGPIVVVLGYEADKARAALAGCDAILVENLEYEQGLSGSLRQGLDALGAEVEGVVVCHGDMPWIAGSDIDRLLAAFSPGDRRLICIATHRGRRGHPVLWAESFFDEMRQLRDEEGARALFARHAEVVCEVESPDPGVLRDHQPREDLQQAG